MTDIYNIQRFLDAQKSNYEIALSELQKGKKIGHWIWYIFPQIKGLGVSTISEYYSISCKNEARSYIDNPVLRDRLIEISETLLSIENKTILEIMKYPDNIKLQSSMTLFAEIAPEYNVFQKVLNKFYGGAKDLKTLYILQNVKND